MVVYRKKKFITELVDGESIKDVFVVKIKKGVSPYKDGYMFHMLLSDRTGRTIDYKYWGGTDEEKIRELYNSIPADGVIYVEGKVGSYSGRLQISSNETDMLKLLEPEEYDQSDFIMPARRNVNEMYNELLAYVGEVSNPDLRSMLEGIFNDPDIREKFKTHPAAIEIHHNWVGGLLTHTLEVLKYCLLSYKLFPAMDKDLLIAGALLHDIGKLDEIEITSRIKGSVKGQLLSHVVIGSIFVYEKCKEYNLDEELTDKLLHIVISHHGRNEYGSPKEPMTAEAITVYYADESSSKIAEMVEFIKTSREDTEDEFMYHRRKQHNIYLR